MWCFLPTRFSSSLSSPPLHTHIQAVRTVHGVPHQGIIVSCRLTDNMAQGIHLAGQTKGGQGGQLGVRGGGWLQQQTCSAKQHTVREKKTNLTHLKPRCERGFLLMGMEGGWRWGGVGGGHPCCKHALNLLTVTKKQTHTSGSPQSWGEHFCSVSQYGGQQ